jgi:hypothetical protein
MELKAKVDPKILDMNTFRIDTEILSESAAGYETMVHKFASKLVELEDQVTRMTLIALGWTPPGGRCQHCAEVDTDPEEVLP